MTSGGRFDFDDGGIYCGGWEDNNAHGHGICTGPKSSKIAHGEYAGSWNHGYEVLGVYTWPSGNNYEGQWSAGTRHGLGIETKGDWAYMGEWTYGFKGRYGIRITRGSRAKYEGSWDNGEQDGYGTEMYSDGGTYIGQWHQDMRHGLGIRQSVPYGLATVIGTDTQDLQIGKMSMRSAEASMKSSAPLKNIEIGYDGHPVGARSGFVLSTQPNGAVSIPVQSSTTGQKFDVLVARKNSRVDAVPPPSPQKTRKSSIASLVPFRRGSTSSHKSVSWASSSDPYSDWYDGNSDYLGSNKNRKPEEPVYDEEIEPNTVETYAGEWVKDKREGLGVCERSDGFKYEGEWLNNCRHGYGKTTFPDGTIEEGKYSCNVLKPQRSLMRWFPLQSSKVAERLLTVISQSRKVAENCHNTATISQERTTHAIQRSRDSQVQSRLARDEANIALCVVKDLAPEYRPISKTTKNTSGNMNQ